jgi:ribulose-5-phosphate 4-epimerase/fuculose-1-phosphate aldolase
MLKRVSKIGFVTRARLQSCRNEHIECGVLTPEGRQSESPQPFSKHAVRSQIEAQLLEGCRRLAGKGLFCSPTNSFSARIPGGTEMILAQGLEDWGAIESEDLAIVPLSAQVGLSGLHASIYRARADAGAVAITSPAVARLLARSGGVLPPLFDEQIRHLGLSAGSLPDTERALEKSEMVFKHGTNAALAGRRLLCIGMTCERAVFNTELYEKCARAYVIARASGTPVSLIPFWVRMIAQRRLLKDERCAAASYGRGCVPETIGSY